MANETAFLGNIREIGRGMMRKKTEMENKKIDNENHLYVKEIFPWGCLLPLSPPRLRKVPAVCGEHRRKELPQGTGDKGGEGEQIC